MAEVRTLLEVCTARATRARGGNPARLFDALRAVPEAMRVTDLVIAWALATVQGSDRRVAFTREYAEYWRVTERQGERDRSRIRALFDAAEFDALIADVATEVRRRGFTAPADELQAVAVDDAALHDRGAALARIDTDHAAVA